MTELDRIYQHDPNIVSRTILDETILVPLRQNVSDFESIYTLNETAAFTWSRLDGQHSLAEIRDEIVKEFAVDAGEAEADLLELIDHLGEIGALEEV